MKRTVYNTVIGLMLACGLTMISTGAFAQGRRPASTSNNAAAEGNRSVATAPKQNAAVSNNASRSTSVQRTTTTTTKPSTTVSNSTVNNRTTTTTKPSSSVSTTTTSRSTASNAGSRSSNSSSSTNVRTVTGSTSGSNSTTVGHGNTGNSGTTVRQSNAGNRSASSSVNTTVNTSTSTVRTKGGNNGSGIRPSVGSNGNSSNVSSNNGGNNGRGHTAPPAGRPTTGTPRPKVGGTVMNGGSTHIDYNTYRYNSSWRPRFDGDPFFNHYRYNSWSWSNPIRPSVRQYRPSTLWFYRPTVTINVSHYSSYPTIAGVLGLRWGTSFTNSLNYLYYNGYYIDGFMDNIVYLTDVQLFDLDWDDVMIRFDRHNNLDYVEFSYWTPTYDTDRFFWLYNELCSIYGRPVSYTNSMFSWYGGSGVGFVNLGLEYTSNNVCYTVLAFGN